MKKIKIIFSVSLIILFIFSGILVSASEEAVVNFRVNGEIKKGNNIEIIVDLSNLKNLYSALVDYAYDNTLIKVKEIVLNKEIEKLSPMQVFNDLDLNGNRARYAFTFTGQDNKGISGDYNFIIIKAEVLKDGELELSNNNIKLQLVQKTENDMINHPFKLSLPGKEVIEEIPEPNSGKSEQENGNSSTVDSNNNVTSINNQNDNKKENIKNSETNSYLDEEAKDESELSSEIEHNDNKVDINENSNVEGNGIGLAIFKIIILIILIVSGYISFRLYKNKKLK